ncbi:MAG: glycosyltransferase family A protein [Nanoarchaeota archaeon]
MKQIDYAILRAWNNPSIVDLIATLDPVVNKMIVVVNGSKDQNGNLLDKINTLELLRHSKFAGKIETRVLENYGWSKALNEGLRMSTPKGDYETRLIISNEVNPTQEQLMEMQKQVLVGNGIASGVYGLFSTGSYSLFDGREEPTYLVPRNTCTLWRSDAMRGFTFNEKLDSQAGMEDVYMGLQIYDKTKLLPSLGPTDVKLSIRQGVNLEEKTFKERETIKRYLPQFKIENVNAYFNALSVLALSKGKGNGMPLLRAMISYE